MALNPPTRLFQEKEKKALVFVAVSASVNSKLAFISLWLFVGLV